MEIGSRLFDLRRKAGLSQEELADLLGVTRQAVQKWEAGTSRPDMDNLIALSRHFNVSLDYLALGTVPAPAPDAGTVVHHYYGRWQYEYKSSRTVLGLPLVHINCGPGYCRAKGIIAIGNIATGFIALGGLSAGLLSLGGVSLGLLLSLGGVAVGLAAIGGLGAGLLALGGFAFGLLTYGGISCGVYAIGGVAVGSQIAMGGAATAPLAIGAATDGGQTFTTTFTGLSEADLAAAKSAIESACPNAPRWFIRLLQFFAEHII